MSTLTVRILLAGAILAVTAPAQAGVSSAGHARTQQLARLGVLPQPGEVIIEDIVNYHRHRLPLPRSEDRVALDLRSTWDAARRVHAVQVGITTAAVESLLELPPLNLAIVVDTSGSMAEAGKMSCVHRALGRFLRGLRPCDRVSIVGFSETAAVMLPASKLGDRRRALKIVRSLTPGGYTNLHGGLMLGYGQVARCFREGATNRVILLTDGIANRGVTDPESIAADSVKYNRRGIDLSTIGVGQSIQRELLQTLARSGRGLFHFVADNEDIVKVFDSELQSLVGPVARHVELKVMFSPELRLERVYGYDAGARRKRLSVTLPIDDLNLGATQVALLELCGRSGEVVAELSFEDERTGCRQTLRRTLCPKTNIDEVARKNHRIARLAAALKETAAKAKAGRHRAALACARRGLLCAMGSEDSDVGRVRRMLERCRDILEARIRPADE